jgi:AcrR family transcriptional regulator
MRQEYHEAMSVARQEDLRANQKARTRAALVTAAGQLLREGTSPSVPEAAERARVSRATAYRYFPTQEALLSEVAVTHNTQPVEQLLASFDTDDVEQRLMQLLDTSVSITLADEYVMRSGLRVFLDQWFENRRLGDDTPVREGRRMRWLDQALAPLQHRLPPAELRRLHAALALTLSIEPITIMHDVCHLDDDAEILAILQWAALAMLHTALDASDGAAQA